MKFSSSCSYNKRHGECTCTSHLYWSSYDWPVNKWIKCKPGNVQHVLFLSQAICMTSHKKVINLLSQFKWFLYKIGCCFELGLLACGASSLSWHLRQMSPDYVCVIGSPRKNKTGYKMLIQVGGRQNRNNFIFYSRRWLLYLNSTCHWI